MNNGIELLLMAGVIILGVFIFNSQTTDTTPPNSCVETGHEWVDFNNGCADICGAGPYCTQSLTMSCDCGPGSCWNHTACIPECNTDSDCSKGICPNGKEYAAYSCVDHECIQIAYFMDPCTVI